MSGRKVFFRYVNSNQVDKGERLAVSRPGSYRVSNVNKTVVRYFTR